MVCIELKFQDLTIKLADFEISDEIIEVDVVGILQFLLIQIFNIMRIGRPTQLDNCRGATSQNEPLGNSENPFVSYEQKHVSWGISLHFNFVAD